MTAPAASTDPRTEAGVWSVPWGLVRVSGPDAEQYLQGQLSQDVRLDRGATSWTFLLEPTGKVLAWLRLTRLADDGYLLDAPFLDVGPVVARLERFKLRTKVDVEVLDRSVRSHRGPGAADTATADAGPGDLVLPANWPGVEGVDVVRNDPAAGSAGADEEELGPWHALRIECGVPRNGAELTSESIPAEAGRWVVDASVSFTKGCYTGQELVARIDSRGGNVPRPVQAVVVDDGGGAPPVGATVHHGERQVGRLTSVARSGSLGVVALAPLARAVGPGEQVELRWDGGAAGGTVAAPPLR